MSSEHFMNDLRRLPYFEEANSEELMVKMSSKNCYCDKKDGKLVKRSVRLEPYYDSDEQSILGWVGQCLNCRRCYYYENK